MKNPDAKPPFIGVEFPRHWKAEENKDLVLLHADKDYSIVLEIMNNHVNLKLDCEELKTSRFYAKLDFKPEHLKKWLDTAYSNEYVNFGHVLNENGSHKIIRLTEQNKVFVLKVSKIETFSNGEKYEPGIRRHGITNGASWSLM